MNQQQQPSDDVHENFRHREAFTRPSFSLIGSSMRWRANVNENEKEENILFHFFENNEKKKYKINDAHKINEEFICFGEEEEKFLV
jgi:hypothetical protein